MQHFWGQSLFLIDRRRGSTAAAPRLTAQNIAFNEVARQAIMRDLNFLMGIMQIIM